MCGDGIRQRTASRLIFLLMFALMDDVLDLLLGEGDGGTVFSVDDVLTSGSALGELTHEFSPFGEPKNVGAERHMYDYYHAEDDVTAN
jgi:hypothetical protein